jgi:pentatricopeptide repeat protein
MSFRYWLRQRLGTGSGADDVPPSRSLLNAVWGREESRLHALGEFTAGTYPRDLTELLARRQDVAEQLLDIDVTDRQARIDSIPQLREMLRTYPHPLVYETLIHAYVDAGRHDEARGIAFAARERRMECMRSEYPEIRSEVDHLSEWTPEDIQALKEAKA